MKSTTGGRLYWAQGLEADNQLVNLLCDLAVYRHNEGFARICPPGATDNVGKAAGEFLDLLPELDIRPAGLQEKDCMSGRFPSFHLMRITPDGDVSR